MMNIYEIFQSKFMPFCIFLTGSINPFWNHKVFCHKICGLFWYGKSGLNQSWNRIGFYIFLFNFSLYFLIDREIEKHLRESVSNQATLDAKMKTHTKSKLLYISSLVSCLLEPDCYKKRQESLNQVTGLGNKERLKVLNAIKLILNDSRGN